MKFSLNSFYYSPGSIWNAASDSGPSGISGVSVFDSNENTLIKIPAPHNSGQDDIIYHGNMDKVLSISRRDGKEDGYDIMATSVQADISEVEEYAKDLVKVEDLSVANSQDLVKKGMDPVHIRFKSSPHAVMALNYNPDGR